MLVAWQTRSLLLLDTRSELHLVRELKQLVPKVAIAEVKCAETKQPKSRSKLQRVSRLVSSRHSSSRTLPLASNKYIDLLISRYSRQMIIATVDFGAEQCNFDATITMRFLLDVLLRTAYLGSTDGIKQVHVSKMLRGVRGVDGS
jgi:hypothetical protein